jgi:fructose-1,6-bisphosphatase
MIYLNINWAIDCMKRLGISIEAYIERLDETEEDLPKSYMKRLVNSIVADIERVDETDEDLTKSC